MERYRVIVPLLNVRNAPVADFNEQNILTTVGKDLILELEEVIDVPNPNLGKWFKDTHGQFFSEIGLQVIDSPIQFNFKPKINHWWITDYGIDKIWETTRGAGVKIAIIDTGLDFNHSNIKTKKNIEYYNVITENNTKEDSMDEGFHGTMCAGMIAAQGSDIYGVAPDADLLIIKATIQGDLKIINLIAAIDYAIKSNVNILNISYSLIIPQINQASIELLHKSIKMAVANNILIVVACGNSGPNLDLSKRYPSLFEECLSVGAIFKNKTIWPLTTLNSNLKILAPGVQVSLLESKTNGIFVDDGTSIAAPFITGICALYFAKNKHNDLNIATKLQQQSTNKEEIKQQLIQNLNIPDLGIINTFKLFNIES